MSRRPRLSDAQRFAWLKLWRTPGIGPANFRSLIEQHGSAAAALAALPEKRAELGVADRLVPPDDPSIESEFESAQALGARFVVIGEEGYPVALQNMHQPPPVLCVRGALSVMEKPMIALVGSRNASANGSSFARSLARDLGANGYAVISGLARGIDRAAHEGSLTTGTVAVLAGGIDQPYPPQNQDIHDAIVEGGAGAIVSTRPMGFRAGARDFPRRNAIIAGSALITVVVEAAERSGSLITARLANENGRIVMAVPGFPSDPRSSGTNALIREGAILIRNVDDVLEIAETLQLAPQPVATARNASHPKPDSHSGMTKNNASKATGAETAMHPASPAPISEPAPDGSIVALLSSDPVHIDVLIRASGKSAAEVNADLLDLELEGRITRHSGGYVSLIT